MKLIDADALLPMIKYATIDSEIGVFPIKIGFNAIKKVIDDTPTVDAVPVRHGKWLDPETLKRPWFRHHIFECSVCRNILDMDGVNAGRGDANYCPNCGARMDERKEE